MDSGFDRHRYNPNPAKNSEGFGGPISYEIPRQGTRRVYEAAPAMAALPPPGGAALHQGGDPAPIPADATLEAYIATLVTSPLLADPAFRSQQANLLRQIAASGAFPMARSAMYINRLESAAPTNPDVLIKNLRDALVAKEKKAGSYEAWQEDKGIKLIVDAIRANLPQVEAEALVSELLARESLYLLDAQWEQAMGSEEAAGKLVATAQIRLKPESLTALSQLADSREIWPVGGRRVPLSWQISRAMNVYVNFLLPWAEADSQIITPAVRAAGPAPAAQAAARAAAEVPRNARVDGPVQARLNNLWTDPVKSEGAPLYTWANGVEKDDLRRFLTNLPPALAGFEPSPGLRARIAAGLGNERINLREVFGRNPLDEMISGADVLWAKELIGFLANSKEAADIAFRLLRIGGELAEDNFESADGTVESHDVIKLYRISRTQAKDARSGKPHGFDAVVGHFPTNEFGAGGPMTCSWWRKAKVQSVEPATFNLSITALQELRAGVPFHKVRWGALNPGTYTVDFLLPLSKALTVFNSVMDEKNNQPELIGTGALDKINAAYLAVFKNTYTPAERAAHPENSPWAWYVIGIMSERNPSIARLDGMRNKPDLKKVIPYENSDSKVFSYQRNIRPGLIATRAIKIDEMAPVEMAPFLYPEEMAFVEKYLKFSYRAPLIGYTGIPKKF